MGIGDWFSNSSKAPSSPPPAPAPAAAPPPPPPPSLPLVAATEKKPNSSVDNDDGVLERIYEGEAGESTDSNIRYAGYGMRIRTILSAAHRYVAYTSDIGESFRPVAHPWLVKGAYGVSWAYITGDVAYEGYKAYLNNKAVLAGLPPPHPTHHHHQDKSTTHPSNPPTIADVKPSTTHRPPPALTAPPSAIATSPSPPLATAAPSSITFLDDYRTVIAQRFIFQAVASMGLPAFTIHSVVRYSGRAMKNVKNVKLRTWGPVGLGLAVVPGLPYLFDEPVERAIEKSFEVLADVVQGGGKGTADKEVVEKREL